MPNLLFFFSIYLPEFFTGAHFFSFSFLLSRFSLISTYKWYLPFFTQIFPLEFFYGYSFFLQFSSFVLFIPIFPSILQSFFHTFPTKFFTPVFPLDWFYQCPLFLIHFSVYNFWHKFPNLLSYNFFTYLFINKTWLWS